MNMNLPKTTAEAVRTYDLMTLMEPYTGMVPTSRHFSEHELDVPVVDYDFAHLVACEPWTNGTDEGNTRYSA